VRVVRLTFAKTEESTAILAGLSGNTHARRVDDRTLELVEPTPRTLRNVRAFAPDVEVEEIKPEAKHALA
jgi:hypothetical protein